MINVLYSVERGGELEYNTRYASKHNLYKPKERTNSGKQTVAFAASVLWDDIPVDLKNLNAFNFSKK